MIIFCANGKFIHYINAIRLAAIIAIPTTTPQIERRCSPYSCADGSSSSTDINTMIPAIIAKIAALRAAPMNGIRIR